MVAPATKITAANFSENDAPRQMPLSRLTPRIPDQSERRISARDTTAIVVATSTAETVTASIGPVLAAATLSAPTGGTVRAGGAMTGGSGSRDAPVLAGGDGAVACADGVL
jgi:hypothetical protein